MTDKKWWAGNSRNEMVQPTTPILRVAKTGQGHVIIANFDNRQDAILAAGAPELLSAAQIALVRLEGGTSKEIEFNSGVAALLRDAIKMAGGAS